MALLRLLAVFLKEWLFVSYLSLFLFRQKMGDFQDKQIYYNYNIDAPIEARVN